VWLVDWCERVCSDAKSAKLVLNAGFDLTMAPLNVTHQIHMNKEFRSALCALGVIGTTLPPPPPLA
jgi:inosine-uridine nucleoside N-ribohydrolase